MSEPIESPEPNPQPEQQSQHMSARVPQHVGSGSFSTGAIVMTGPNEFIVDFVQAMGGAPLVASRVVMPHAALPKFVDALQRNLELYTQKFGSPPEMPQSSADGQPRSPQELYDELKLPDELLSGAYSNGVMITHTAAEFRFDFLTNMFPTSAVSARVFLSAPQVTRLLQSLQQTWRQFQDRLRPQQTDDSEGLPDPPPGE